MSSQLMIHSPDLKRLSDDGYQISIQDDYLVIDDVPYVDKSRIVKKGTLVSDISLAGDRDRSTE